MTKTEFNELRKFLKKILKCSFMKHFRPTGVPLKWRDTAPLRRTNVLSLIAITAQKQCSATHIKQFYSVKVPPHSLLLQLSTNASTYICV